MHGLLGRLPVRSERSPLHDVRQHAHADASRTKVFTWRILVFLTDEQSRRHIDRLRLKALAGNLRGSKLGLPAEAPKERRLVEPDGIEPTTSCLQSRRSPN